MIRDTDAKGTSMSERKAIPVDAKLPAPQACALGLQHFLSMFGATVLVPLLMGFSPSVSVMCSGLGTIIYLLCTKQRIPSYLGPSFSFIGPIVAASAVCGPSGVGSGIVAAGLVFAVIAFVIWRVGTRWIDALVPPPVMAAIIIVIGCGLAATAVSEAFLDGAGNPRPWQEITVAFVALLVVVACTCFGKRLLGTIPVLAGAAVAYALACVFGLVDFSAVAQAPWFGLPEFTFPSFDLGAIALVAPIALVVVIEHIGHLFVIGQMTGVDYGPILHRSILGDGLATVAAGFLGAPPATTFAENIGVMSVTRVYATQIFWYAAGAALVVGGFCPKLGALVGTIPDPVIGGVSIIIFGLIACNGLKMLVENGIDLSDNRTVTVVCAPIVVGVGMQALGAGIPIGDYSLPGLAAAALLGITLNLVLPKGAIKNADPQPTRASKARFLR